MTVGVLIALCGGVAFWIGTLWHDSKWSTRVGQAAFSLAYVIVALAIGVKVALGDPYTLPLPTVPMLTGMVLIGCVFYLVSFHRELPAGERAPVILSTAASTPLAYLTVVTTGMGDPVNLAIFAVTVAIAAAGPVSLAVAAYEAWAAVEPPAEVAS